MFIKIKNIETAFQHIRLFCLLVILGCFFCTGFAVYQSYKIVDLAQQRIYILSSGRALEAFAGERRENIPVEARDHIRSFHMALFTLDPDERLIKENITRALYLADGSARQFYDNLKESGYYANILSANISQQLAVDSIQLGMNAYPFYFRCYATQTIIRATSKVTRDLITEGWLRTVSRSDNNPHGFLIERWNTLENKDLKIESR